jgi:hypothetical protein
MGLNTLAGMNVAARLMAEAGKLKQRLPAPESPPHHPIDYTLSTEDWLAMYAPKDGGEFP